MIRWALNGPYGLRERGRERERVRWEREMIIWALNGPYGLERERANERFFWRSRTFYSLLLLLHMSFSIEA